MCSHPFVISFYTLCVHGTLRRLVLQISKSLLKMIFLPSVKTNKASL